MAVAVTLLVAVLVPVAVLAAVLVPVLLGRLVEVPVLVTVDVRVPVAVLVPVAVDVLVPVCVTVAVGVAWAGASYAPMLGGVGRGVPLMSVVTPGMLWPAPPTGEPGSGCRLLLEVKSGLALIEFWSPCVEERYCARLVWSTPKKFRKPATLPEPVL